MTDALNQTARYLAETLDRERVYRAYWRNTLTSAISEIVFQESPVVTWQIVDHHDDGRVVAGDASFSSSVVEAAAKRRAAQDEQTLPDKVAVFATEARAKLADEDERGDGDIVQDDPDTQRIEQQMWDTARALQQVQDDEQQPAPFTPWNYARSYRDYKLSEQAEQESLHDLLQQARYRHRNAIRLRINSKSKHSTIFDYELALGEEHLADHLARRYRAACEAAGVEPEPIDVPADDVGNEDEQQPTPPGYRRGLTEAEARAHAQQIAQDEELLTSPAADKARELKRIDDILTDAWRDARDYQQLSDYQDEAAPHAYEALDGLINAVRLILKRLH